MALKKKPFILKRLNDNVLKMTDKLNIPSLDNHHYADIFKMIHLLDDAIKTNSRESFEPIITFLSTQTLDHFKEEERLMKKIIITILNTTNANTDDLKIKLNH